MADKNIEDTMPLWPEWKMKQDPEDGSWEVGYERDGRHILLAYGLSRDAALVIAAAPEMYESLAQIVGWVEECGSAHEGRQAVLTEARAALRKMRALHS